MSQRKPTMCRSPSAGQPTVLKAVFEAVLQELPKPPQHRTKLHSTNPIEPLTARSSSEPRWLVVGIFPNEDAIVRFIGAILLEQNDEWAVERARYMTPETIAPLSDDPTVSLPAIAS